MEVEEGVCIKIEEALTGVEGVKKSLRLPMKGDVKLQRNCMLGSRVPGI